MTQRGRPGLSAQQKTELWSRWRQGQSLSEIGRALGKHAGSIYGVLAATAAITPAPGSTLVPALCRLPSARRYRAAWLRGRTIRAIAARLRRAPSTVSREMLRKRGAREVPRSAGRRPRVGLGRRPKASCSPADERSGDWSPQKLQEDWSPEQIAGWLAATDTGDPAMRVSHETIYRSLYLQSARRSAPGAASALAKKRTMRSGKRSQHRRPAARADHRRGVHSRPTRRDRRSAKPGPLGRRPDRRRRRTRTSRLSSRGTRGT